MVALRSDDPVLAAAVGEVVEWLDGDLVLCPSGAAPVPAHVHLDDGAAARTAGVATPSWGSGVVAVAREVHGGGATVSGRSDPSAPPGSLERPFHLPAEAGELADAISARAVSIASTTIGVVGVGGGAGASVTAALLARAVSEGGRSTGLVDLSGGLDVMLGIEDEPGPRWADLTAEAGPFPADTLVAHLPRWAGVHVLACDVRGAPTRAAVSGVLASTRRACRVVVVDLPRTAGPDLLRQCDVVVVVAGTDAVAAAGLTALARRLAPLGLRTGLAARRSPGAAIADPAELARWCGLPLLAALPRSPTLRGDLARGLGPGERRRSGLTRAVRALADELGLV
ncbi:Septum site-determining protein MinD [Serinibacter arcticus]|uniref:Septum site-determining protein MinD n=1 Tax=Serinibacter arcticus TaxID=1655435 RepID=A0A4Z1E3I4_9MICO|nr:Septum site-determining protein MinD [Serinibacter arcticus]